MSLKAIVQRAAGTGRWFPAQPGALRQAVEGYLDAAQVPAITGRLLGGIAPHAGYQYSGPVAGYTFRALRDNATTHGAPQIAVILGFSHRHAFEGVALLDGDAFATPLGQTPLDREARAALCAAGNRVVVDSRPHGGEHSAENQIPFVQTALPDARLVVALLGDHEPVTIRQLSDGLAALARRQRIVVIASTDLLHDSDYETVRSSDAITLAQIASLDATGLARAWSPDHQICCGIAPVLALIRFVSQMGCRTGLRLYARNSGDDFPASRGEWVVGYGAVVFPDK
ncbi:MAG: AmmeMemoRadiSam system protein B [bacterium]